MDQTYPGYHKNVIIVPQPVSPRNLAPESQCQKHGRASEKRPQSSIQFDKRVDKGVNVDGGGVIAGAHCDILGRAPAGERMGCAAVCRRGCRRVISGG